MKTVFITFERFLKFLGPGRMNVTGRLFNSYISSYKNYFNDKFIFPLVKLSHRRRSKLKFSKNKNVEEIGLKSPKITEVKVIFRKNIINIWQKR